MEPRCKAFAELVGELLAKRWLASRSESSKADVQPAEPPSPDPRAVPRPKRSGNSKENATKS